MIKVPAHIDELLKERNIRIEPATIEDLPILASLVADLMEVQPDFYPDEVAQTHGIKTILSDPKKGRILVIRNDDDILGMVNLLFTITTALGGHAVLLEDVIIHPEYRHQGLGSIMLDYAVEFALQKGFKRITLLADKSDTKSQDFFQKKGFSYSKLIPMRRVLNEQ